MTWSIWTWNSCAWSIRKGSNDARQQAIAKHLEERKKQLEGMSDEELLEDDDEEEPLEDDDKE